MSYYDHISVVRLPAKTGSLLQKELPADGNMVWTVTTPPAIEPVSIDELKVFSRITTSAEDDLLGWFIHYSRKFIAL